ncbi:N-acetylmannosamine kinase [Edwardsiella anguillarum]|uniref:N-acetylmannosamine kinase n=2 Tax=Edwardsiella anguillarum TaxID=1821960 RepID=A0A076LWE1_9GAMM|nr:N-acetylmannosamine kinase [Edwardsiella anguillarum]AIJ09794.1 N-acetylmannosamine kinase [Edwardsiella anguillarum ET080813]KAB0592725.1 ROK family protein [Edwardsiella anguillarum]WHP85292.1 N-acetylmannosamine kinase [Edwardsiella anguillarum]WHP89075.1 N-acetylmannosamine kinase [Edwardsiella anguillarum]WHP92874.1 N-acetylmannosamine kinase [Edwardsiella anguillarum]
MSTLAIDIGGTKLACALVGADRQIRERRELPTPASQTPDALRTALQTLVAPLQRQASRVAIASTGIIRQGTLLAINPSNLGGLLRFPLVETLRELTGLPTLALNDAQAAAWAEYQPLAVQVRDMLFITASTGVGSGMVRDGRLVQGQGGLAGHIGHTLADPQGPRCGCGRVGCVEAIASGCGIAAAARGALAGADIKAVTDCQCVVIGGSVGLAEGYLQQVAQFLAAEPAPYQVALRAAYYRYDTGLLGVAWLAQGEG